MAHFPILTAFLCLPIFTRALIQSWDIIINSTAKCQGGFDWASNKEGSSPCLILAAVSAPCYGSYTTKPLLPNEHYDDPDQTNRQITACSCSWAAYNLLGACTACQGLESESIHSWPQYSTNCGNYKSDTTFWPSEFQIGANQTIPYYAQNNPNNWKEQRFDVSEAQALAAQNKPDYTGVPITGPDPPKKGKPVGAIVGGTVGGVLLVLFLLLLFYMCRRRRASLGVQEVPARRPSFFSPGHGFASDWESRKRGISMVSNSSLGTVSTSRPFSSIATPSMYTTYDRPMGSFSQTGPASMYTTPSQMSHSYQRHSGVISPAPTMQTIAPGPPDHIQPFTLMSTGEAPDTLAYRRKASLGGSPSELVGQSVTVPALSAQVTEQQRPPAMNHEETRHLEVVAEEEDQARVTGRGRSESQPPAYSFHPPSNDMALPHEVAAARREVNGHGHLPVESSPEKGSQASQTSWTSSGDVSQSTVNSTTGSQEPTREEVLQTPRPDRDQRYRSVLSAESRDDSSPEVA
ncbi:hypothetical protein E1B28_002248 [Marasmius oreades]|uniref:Uncharacterized protein n=1 Tax=Marasmius oreades TaxID=181124 RepID=A0A9P7UNS1_9AGAR|nr:uncharacterized protein E1B28_002248 [Marasmius oreades]KAG7086284.1 hypothetical protein E1B28_002248 [Marasmius oreades]